MKDKYDVYTRACPARLILDRISNKWSMLILDRLKDETLRFNRLKREIDGISQKVLSQTLKNLERDGLIHREAFPTVPIIVEYKITSLGQTLTEAVGAVVHWAEQNGDAVIGLPKSYMINSTPSMLLHVISTPTKHLRMTGWY